MQSGSRAAVYCFNEVARGLQYVLLDQFGIVCSKSYDDFLILQPRATAADSAAAFENACYGWGHHGHKNGGNSKEENARLRNEDDHSQQRRSKASGATVDHSNASLLQA